MASPFTAIVSRVSSLKVVFSRLPSKTPESIIVLPVTPPTSFQSKKVELVSKSIEKSEVVLKLKVTGTLTLHGVSKSITIPVSVRVKGGSVVTKGACQLTQSHFGITPFSKFLGTVKVKDKVKVAFEITSKSQ
jgi:hypothetical protein